MSRRLVTLGLGLSLLSGCSLTSQHQEMLERAAQPRESGTYLIGRSVDENAVICRYSDGTVVRHLNTAAPCF